MSAVIFHGLMQLLAIVGIVVDAWRHNGEAAFAWFMVFAWISIASSREERIAILEAKAKIDRIARGDG